MTKQKSNTVKPLNRNHPRLLHVKGDRRAHYYVNHGSVDLYIETAESHYVIDVRLTRQHLEAMLADLRPLKVQS